MFSALLIEHFFSLIASKELVQPSVNITDLIKLWKLTMKPMKDHPGLWRLTLKLLKPCVAVVTQPRTIEDQAHPGTIDSQLEP